MVRSERRVARNEDIRLHCTRLTDRFAAWIAPFQNYICVNTAIDAYYPTYVFSIKPSVTNNSFLFENAYFFMRLAYHPHYIEKQKHLSRVTVSGRPHIITFPKRCAFTNSLTKTMRFYTFEIVFASLRFHHRF